MAPVSTAAVWTPAKEGDDATGADAESDWMPEGSGSVAVDATCVRTRSGDLSAAAACVDASGTAPGTTASTPAAAAGGDEGAGDEDAGDEGAGDERCDSAGNAAPAGGAGAGTSAAVWTAGAGAAAAPDDAGAAEADAAATVVASTAPCEALAVLSDDGGVDGEPIATTKQAIPVAATAEAPAPSPHFSRRARASS
jgi:hypothetical protein